jgi:hypothetical protein
LLAANPRAADRLAGGWPPAGLIVMTPQQPLNYYPFSVRLITQFTGSNSSSSSSAASEDPDDESRDAARRTEPEVAGTSRTSAASTNR